MINHTLFPARETIVRWLAYMNNLGPRLTRSTAHAQFTAYIKSELESFGIPALVDTIPFVRWEQRNARLTVDQSEAVEINLSAAFPYSGQTPPEGVSGELIACPKKRDINSVKDKIVLVEMRVYALPSARIFKRWRGTGRLPPMMRSPVVASTLKGNLTRYREAGAKGVVFVWRGISAENAAHQYLPFTTPYQDCPAVFVPPEAGRTLRSLYNKGVTATLTLEADIGNATSDTVYGVLPGSNDAECIIINTHTDGPNACQENGPVGLLALARYFSLLPTEQRQRTLVFVFTTGHFQLPQFGIDGQATSRWLSAHPELWDGQSGRRAVAGLTLEHLGAMGWRDAKTHDGHTYLPTGDIEPELIYASNRMMADIYTKASAGRTKGRPVLLKPARMYFGEGEPLHKVGIPTLSMVPAPQYLCAAPPGGYIEKLDTELMEQQIQTFANAIHMIDQTTLS